MKLKEIIPYILIGVLGVMFVQARCDLMRDISNNTPVPYILPDDVVMQAEFKNHILQLARRIDGDSSYVITTYIPTESTIEYIVRTDTLALGRLENAYILLAQLKYRMETASDSARVDSLEVAILNLQRALYVFDVEYDTHGTCLVPEVGVGLDTDARFNIEAGARLYYINRFGIGLHGAMAVPADSSGSWGGSVGIFGDWRIPGFDNSALFTSLDHEFPSARLIDKAMLGIHIYLN